MNQATAKVNGQEKPADDLIREFCQNLENCNSIEDRFTIITSLFESLDVTIERIGDLLQLPDTRFEATP